MCTVELILKGAFIATQVLTSSFFAKGRNMIFLRKEHETGDVILQLLLCWAWKAWMAGQLLILAQVLPSRGPLVAKTLVLLMQEKRQREGRPTIGNRGKIPSEVEVPPSHKLLAPYHHTSY